MIEEQKGNFTTRALEIEEYKEIMKLLLTGFKYVDDDGKKRTVRPNKRIWLALLLEGNLGLRITDILKLTPYSFLANKFDKRESKTKKIQYRPVNPEITVIVQEYIIDNNIQRNELIFKGLTVRSVQRILSKVVKYLDLRYVSTHSFRKMYATEQYEKTNFNLEITRELLNHKSVETTQRYIKAIQKEVDEASANFYIPLD